MKKILVTGLLCLLIALNTGHLPANDEESGNVKNSDAYIHKKYPKPPYTTKYKLRLFRLSQLVSYHYLQPILLSKGLRLGMGIPRLPEITLTGIFKEKSKKRFGRALLTGVGHFAYSVSSYYVREDVMKEDWEYQFTWEDQRKRFLFMDGMRFDSNTFAFNWTHSLAGALYYNYARTNFMNPLESFLYSTASSYFWEFLVEFREVVSINDSISTPIGGLSYGEATFQLGRFFRSRRPTFLNRIARFISNPIMALNDWIDPNRAVNQYAFTDDYWYDASIYMGPRFDTFETDESHSLFQLGFESQLIHLPEYGAPGYSNRYVGEVMFTQLDMEGTFNFKGLYSFNLFAKTTFFGYFKQNIRSVNQRTRNYKNVEILDAENSSENEEFEDEGLGLAAVDQLDDDLVGYSLFLGISSAFDMTSKDPEMLDGEPTASHMTSALDREDKYSVINIIGPTLDFTLYQKGMHIRFTLDLYADFAMVHSHAFREFAKKHGSLPQTKSTLENHGYYYAFGFTAASTLQFDFSHVQLKGKIKFHHFNSIEGLDRFQTDIGDEDDYDLADNRTIFNLSLGYTIPDTGLQVVLGLEHTKRKGTIEHLFSQSSTERRSYVQIRFRF